MRLRNDTKRPYLIYLILLFISREKEDCGFNSARLVPIITQIILVFQGWSQSLAMSIEVSAC